MQIPRSVLDALTESLNMLSGATKTLITQRLSNIEYASMADLRNQVIDLLEPILSAATDTAASYSANTYDTIRELSTGEMMGAQAVSGRKSEATQVAVRAMVPTAFDNSFDAFLSQIIDRADYEIKRAAGECTLHNAERDPLKPRFARVPTGAETCDFCIMLASRGFVYHSEETAGAFDHWHPHCDCRVIQGYPGDTVEGYDPDEYYRQWKESGFNPNKSGKGRNRSKFEYESDREGVPSFKNFDDVKNYLYESESQNDLEHRYNVLGNIFGFEKMRSQSVKNVLKTAGERIGAKRGMEDDQLALGHIYLNKDTELFKRLQKVTPIDGYEDFGIHSNGRTFEYTDASDDRGKTTEVSVSEYARMIRENQYYNGGAIRLLACSAGKYSDGAAQMLADILEVDVCAADKDIFVDFDGTITLADSLKDAQLIRNGLLEETGNWIIFHPKASRE